MDPTDLQQQIESWNQQAALKEITYQALEAQIRQKSRELADQFAERKLEWDDYEVLKAALVLHDAAGQKWLLFADGTWQRKVDEEWEAGEPNFSSRVSHPPEEESHPSRFPMPLWGVGAAGLLLVAILGLLIIRLGGGTPSLTETPSPSPTFTPTIVAALPTGTPLPPSPTPAPTDTPLPPPPTSIPTDTPLPPSPTPAPTDTPFPPSPTSIPTDTPLPPSPTPTPTDTPFPPSPTSIPTDTPLPPSPTPAPTDTPLPISPSPVPTPYGTIVYAAFDEKAGTYNIYFRSSPNWKVVRTIPQASQPAVQPEGQRFAYRSWDSGRQGVLRTGLYSTGIFNATGILEAMHPAWSSDSQLVFAANNVPDQQWHLYVNDQMLPVDGSLEGPAWLNNDRLVFHGCVVNGCGIFVANADGSNLQRLTTSNRDLNPAPSPDGGQIAFMSNRSGNWEIYRIAVDSSENTPTPLTARAAADVLPAWSPDGYWIAFVSNHNKRWAMWLVPASGGNPQHLFDMEGAPHGFVVSGPPGQTGWLQEQISWFK